MGEPTQMPNHLLWRMLDFRSDEPDELGQLTMHFHLKNVENNQTYIVSISGHAHAPSKDFALACHAAAKMLIDTATQQPPIKIN
jgi:hypothetical protein